MHPSLPLLLAQAGGPSGLMNILFLVALFAIMYFLLIRPQQKQAKEHRAFLETLKKGDDVVTGSGIIGRVHAVMDKVVLLEVASGVKLRVVKSAVQGKAPAEETASAAKADEKKEEK